MPNLYADIADFQRTVQSGRVLREEDLIQVERLLEAVSRLVDQYCNRTFYEETATRYFDGTGTDELPVPDLLAITSIKIDEDLDGTWEFTLATTDYWPLRPGARDEYGALPKTLIRLNRYEGKRGIFIHGRKAVEIVGRWGFTDETVDIGQTVAVAQTAAGTTLEVADARALARGMTVKIESEQEYVESISGQIATVRRAVNGTTGATHAIATAINRYVYPPDVRQATIIQASRIWKRRETGFAGDMIVNPVSGQISLTRGLDQDARQLLSRLVRYD